MKRKKGIIACSVLALGIIISSKVVFAQTVHYSFRLPKTGSMNTSAATKNDNSDAFLNYVSYNGRPGNTINFWGVDNNNGAQATETASFTGKGNMYSYYLISGSDMQGKDIYMRIKTGSDVWFAIDVTGDVTP